MRAKLDLQKVMLEWAKSVIKHYHADYVWKMCRMVSEEKDPATLWNMHKKNIVPMLHSYLDVVDFVEARLDSEMK